ncbi:hypothetical protein BGZ99_003598 [Dissophora globulifera]|uniref:Uncharacterized protein n=1 Tax=Dissophora globulifera TaxID=979702 RepID=A0A9P6UW60_9FUNG|nr:hypothetical protein BGZ99_003598 [Dissophora globulifera]
MHPAWTLLPEVLAARCPSCATSRVRKLSHLDPHDPPSEPAAKRRMLDDSVVAVDVERAAHSTTQSGSSQEAGHVRNKHDWILARQWRELLGHVPSTLPPCGHALDLQAQHVPVSLTLQDGTAMVMLSNDILAMRQDDPEDLSWGSDFGARDVPRSRTLLAAVNALKHTNQIALDATICQRDSPPSAALHVRFDLYFRTTLLSGSLSCRGSIAPEMQDLVRLAFPPLVDASHRFTDNAIKDLYAHLRPAATVEPPSGIQPALLQPQLLPFQRRSVAWCLQRECGIVNPAGEVEYKEPTALEKLPFSWEHITTPAGESLFINRLCGLLCRGDPQLVDPEPEPRGGILAEEMGLGKTVEMLALILLNRRKLDTEDMAVDAPPSETSVLEEQLSHAHLDDSEQTGRSTSLETEVDNSGTSDVSSTASLIKSAATLIITPISILHQWASEIENHAPSLRVFVYTDTAYEQITAEQLARYDVVLTTYPVLSKEINYTNQYDRPRRYERQYVPRKSHFVMIDWWRVCLDEAQMIEGVSVSQAAAMTLMIPRVMSWAISGTPIRRHIEDLQSLLLFLNQEPVASNKRLWKLLSSFSFRSTFVSSYQRIMHRYAKRDVVQELALPPQFRQIYGIHFTEIERANYNEKWEQCLAECDVDIANDNSEEAESLQSWFMRLRQTCCHPQIGSRNKEALGKTNLRTIDEVLGVMVQQNNAQLYIKERNLFITKLKRAVLKARIHKDIAELQPFKLLEDNAARQVTLWQAKFEELRVKRVQERLEAQAASREKGKEVKQELSEYNEDDLDDIDILSKSKPAADDPYGTAMMRHRDWLEQQHRTLFFTANLYHELEMEAEETDYYKQAEDIRQQILALPEQKFDKVLEFIRGMVQRMTLDSHYSVPSSSFAGGIVMSRHLERLRFISNLLNQQLEILSRWRQDLTQRLTQPLMQDGEEGEQYQFSIDLQHTLESYLHFYGRMLLFRRDLVSGSEETVTKLVADVKAQRERAEMVKRRENRIRTFKRKGGEEKQAPKEEDLDKRLEKEMNDLVTEDLASTLRSIRADIKAVANDNSYPSAERQMAEVEDLRLKDEQTRQAKLILDLEKEVVHFRYLTAARTGYYKQLQVISDTVQDIESYDPEEDIGDCLEEENKLQTEIIRLVSKQRYLDHLAETNQEEIDSKEERLCLICRSQYDLGLVTECGHVFCEHCLLEWTKNHHKCPSCNSQISRRRLARVTMAEPVANGLGTESSTDVDSLAVALGSSLSDLAADADKNAGMNESANTDKVLPTRRDDAAHMQLVPEAIRRMPVQDGYGSKIDSIVRHISFLVREDASTKCLVFSQWSNLLALLGDSLKNNRIGFVRLQGSSIKTAVKEFKENPDKHVFMLHAKSQSAGLTLLSATHIFICEPLVNPVLQAQAVSRVHRIGQTKETFVYYYLIQRTVEVPCFDLFERKQAAAAGASLMDHHQDLEQETQEAVAESSQAAKRRDPQPMQRKDDAGAAMLDSDMATTASEVARAQNRNGELVKLEDLKYCFRVQKQMYLEQDAEN